MRRLVLCLDGTWNNAERGTVVEGGHKRYKPTNVLKIYRAVKPAGDDGTSQVSYYGEGVGAFIGEPSRLLTIQRGADRLFGGAYGGGFEGGVKAAYRFLVGNYRTGDEIFVFGFSRGAAQARSLVRFVDWLGGVLEKKDEYYIPELFDRYRDSGAGVGAAARAFAAIRSRGSRGQEAIRELRPVTIRFLGVYDTVLALGMRLRADREETLNRPTVARRHAFHIGDSPPPIVRTARQALAVDESRWDYRPQVWSRPGGRQQSLEQRWFPGVHTNVGGGRKDDGVANCALDWMVGEAAAAGLALDGDYLKPYKCWFGDERPDGPSRLFRWVDTVRGKRGKGRRPIDRGDAAHLSLHATVLRLMLHEERYRPANVLAYLKDHREAVQLLEEPARRARLTRIVDSA